MAEGGAPQPTPAKAKRRWKPGFLPTDLAKETWRQMQRANLLLVASSLAYTTILSLIPMLAVSFAIFKAFGGLERLYQVIEPFILSNLAEGSSEDAIVALRRFLENVHTSAVGIGGFVGLVLTSMSMLHSIEGAINTVWGAPMRRNYFQRIVSYWFFITLGPLALSVGLGVVTTSNLPLSQFVPDGTGIFFLTIFFFTAVFKWVPNCDVHWPYAIGAAAVTAVFLTFARVLYALYTSTAVSYNKIYGSLSAVPIFLLWIYIVWVIVLTGAALSAALQSRLEIRRGQKT
jgi:membrane protein